MPIEGVEEILKSELGLSYIKYLESKHSFISDGRVYDVGSGKRIFVKVNGKDQARRMFEGELDSIEELSKLNLLRLPKPIQLIDLPGGGAAQVLEYIEMVWLTSAQNIMGEQLARLHLDNHNKMQRWKLLENFVGSQSKEERPVEKFGYHTTTCCGYLPQYTDWENEWSSFYTKKLDNRISYVVQRDGDREVNELWTNIMRGIPKLFSCINIKPSLLHGDFWRGNSGQTLAGEPENLETGFRSNTITYSFEKGLTVDIMVDVYVVMFDPCCFYGHSEFDLSIGFVVPGFDTVFYESYFELIPKDAGFDDRLDLYKLFFYFNTWAHFGVNCDENCKRVDILNLMRKILHKL